MLFSVAFVNINLGQTDGTVVAVEPETVRGNSGDYFDILITITDVTDLRAYGFVLNFAPFTSVLNVVAVDEGDFLSEGAAPGVKTWFVTSVDTFAGELTVGCTRDKDLPGVSGSGTLVIIHFNVVEAGTSPLDLEDVKLYDSDLDPIPCTVLDGEYIGPTATMKHPQGRITQPTWHVGDMATFSARAKNTADVPLYVKVRFTFQREDGEAAYIWTDQSYTGFGPEMVEYAYVDGFIPAIPGWPDAGPPEALFGTPDGTYIESAADGDMIAFYTFEDLNVAGRIVEDVDLEAYSKCQFTGPDIDTYIFTYDEYGNPVMSFAWGDSLGGTTDWAWTRGKYYDGTQYDMPQYYGNHILTEQGINSCELLLYQYGGGVMQIDAVRLEVTYSKYSPAPGGEASFLVLPGETIDLPPAVWFLSEFDTGYYHGSCTLHFSYGNEWFIRSHNPPAFNFDFEVLP
jgi:hypothetical protein